MKKYFRVWRQLMSCAFQSYSARPLNSVSFMAAKLMRFGFFWLMIVSLFNHTSLFGGFTRYQALLLFITYNLVDVLSQALFRGIYLFSQDVNRGLFDYCLVRPVPALFYSLLRLTDILDFFFLIPIIGLFIYTLFQLGSGVTLSGLIGYGIFFIIGFAISLSLHIFSAALSFWTLQSENIIWFYRRAAVIGGFPPTVLSAFWQTVFTYVLPIIIMTSFPTRALFGGLTMREMAVAVLLAALFLSGSLLAWRVSLRRYSSASS